MSDYSEVAFLASRVTAVFEGKLLSFMLPGGTTFEDLADRIDGMGERKNGSVIAIRVRIGASPENWPSAD